MKKFHDLPALIAAAKVQISEVDVVSFDVFDTLLVRRVHEPDFVKTATARYINELMQEFGLWGNIGYVMNVRNTIERQHRQRNGQSFPDYEANYDQFMPEVLQDIFGQHYTSSLFEKVSQYEIDMENSMLVARADIVEFLGYLKEKGKRLFLVSDMYLPAKYIREMVKDKGLESYFEAIVSSADTFNAKASGTGYSLLEKTYQLDKTRWMHIGDNHHSDGVKANQFGLKSFIIEDFKERQRKGICFRYHHYARHDLFWRGRYAQQLMMPLEGENKQAIKERLVELNIKKLYFCSREGWMFKECWDRMGPILWPNEYNKIKVEYLYVSRLALASASRANLGLTLQDANRVFAPIQNKDFNDIVRVFGLNKDNIAPYLEEYELAFDEMLSPEGRTKESLAKLVRLINDEGFIQQIKQDARESQMALECYLDSVGFFDESQVALMDIGWIGTIQFYLSEAISHRADTPLINGFLLGADRKHEFPTTDKSRYEGLLYDRMRLQHAPSNILAFKDVLEEICRANHPTLLGYKVTEQGEPDLVFRTAEDSVAEGEEVQFDYYRPLHDGIFDGIERFAAAMAVANYSSHDIRTWTHMLCYSRIAFAKTEEILRLKNQFHQDDFAGSGPSIPVSKKLAKSISTLWGESSASLKFVPFLRTRHFLKAMKQLMRV